MKKTIIKIITAVFLSLFIALSASSLCFAQGDRVVRPIEITEEGAVFYEKSEGVSEYWLGVNGNFVPFANGMKLSENGAGEPGEYRISIEGYSEGGEFFLEEIQCVVIYDGSVYKIKKNETDTAQTETETETETDTETEKTTEEVTETEKAPETTEPLNTETTAEITEEVTTKEPETTENNEKQTSKMEPETILSIILVVVFTVSVGAALLISYIIRRKGKK